MDDGNRKAKTETCTLIGAERALATSDRRIGSCNMSLVVRVQRVDGLVGRAVDMHTTPHSTRPLSTLNQTRMSTSTRREESGTFSRFFRESTPSYQGMYPRVHVGDQVLCGIGNAVESGYLPARSSIGHQSAGYQTVGLQNLRDSVVLYTRYHLVHKEKFMESPMMFRTRHYKLMFRRQM